MNWIDKIFKDQLGNRKFPDEVRNKGKADLESLLDREMPLSTPKAGKSGWFYGGLSGLVLALVAIPAGIWYFQQQNNDKQVQQEYSLNFGKVDSQAEAFIVKNRTGTSGSWGTESDDTKFKGMEVEDNSNNSYADSEEPQAEPESNSGFNSIQNTTRAKDRNEITDPKKNNITTPIVANDFSTDKTPELQNKKENVDADTELGQESSSFTEVEENVELVNETSASETEALAQITTDVLDTKVDETANSSGATLEEEVTSDNPIAISAVSSNTEAGDKKVEVEEEVSEPSIVAQAEAAKKPDLPDNEKKKAEDPEDQNLEDIEKSESPDEEGKVEETRPASKVILSNLAFSEVPGNSPADLSQYKSLSPKRMAISIWGGYAYVGKSIKGGDPDYLSIREQKEEAIWTMPTGLTFDYYLTSKWTVSVGAGFSEYGEVLNYDYEYEQKGYVDGRYGSPNQYANITRLDSVRVITGINQGHWDYYFDYSKSDTAIKNNNGQTRWSYVEVPVMFGYRFGNGKLKPWLQAGVSLGIPYNQSFRYVSPSGDGLQTRAESQGAAADLQLNGLLNVGLDFYLSRHFSLRLNAFGSYQLTPSFKFEGIEQRYYRLGGTVGLAYNF